MITNPCKNCGKATKHMGTPHPRLDIPLCGRCWAQHGKETPTMANVPERAVAAAAGPAQPEEDGSPAIYETSDLGLTAALTLNANLKFVSVEVDGRGLGRFRFLDPRQLGRSISAQYYESRLQVPAYQFHMTLRNMKTAVMEERRRLGHQVPPPPNRI